MRAFLCEASAFCTAYLHARPVNRAALDAFSSRIAISIETTCIADTIVPVQRVAIVAVPWIHSPEAHSLCVAINLYAF